MKKRKGFTLIELLVVIAIIALLMSLLMPALSKAKNQAKAIVCINNLHQFAIVWKMYLDDNENWFPEDMHTWIDDTAKYWKDPGIVLCPYASKHEGADSVQDRGDTHHAWKETINGTLYLSSYGLNQYCSRSAEEGSDNRSWEEMFPNATISFADRVPLMGDCAMRGATPQEMDEPPEYSNQTYYSIPGNQNEIRAFCIDRHNYAINMLFLDWHVDKVGLKYLWVLKWKKDWNLPPEPLPEWFPWMASLSEPSI